MRISKDGKWLILDSATVLISSIVTIDSKSEGCDLWIYSGGTIYVRDKSMEQMSSFLGIE